MNKMIAVKKILLIGLLWIPVWATAFDISQSLLRNELNSKQDIIFLDAQLQAYKQLIQPGQAVFVLDPTQDGIQQITNILTRYTDVKAIHLVSHGLPGQVQLGTTWLQLDNLEHYRQALSQWFNTPTAEILIYGCQVAQGAEGTAFVHKLAQLTAADVAASVDLTGHGGNWRLEQQVGTIETPVAFSESVRRHYPGVMQTLPPLTIVVKDENDQIISDYFDWGQITIGGKFIKTFKIENTGDTSVTLKMSINNNSKFTLFDTPDEVTIEPDTPASFNIRLNTDIPGEASAAIVLESDQLTESYTFNIRGIIGCAKDLTVTTAADNGNGSLRDALAHVCEGGIIHIDNTQVITPIQLTSGELIIDKNVTLTTDSPTPRVTLQGDNQFRIFYVDSGLNVAFNNLLITQGLAEQGAGIYNQGSFITLSNTHICRNKAQGGAAQGGGIYNTDGQVTLKNSFVCDNEANGQGGGIVNIGVNAQLILEDQSSIEGNIATSTGGGIFNMADIKITDSTIAANRAESGAGIANSGNITVDSSTLIGNQAQQDGGGIYNQANGLINLTDTQLNQNQADQWGGGIANVDSAIINMEDSHLTDNVATLDGSGFYNAAETTSTISNTCIVSNSAPSVVNVATSSAIQAQKNWWGAIDGPGGSGSGAGDSISDSVNYEYFKAFPLPHCSTPLYGSEPEVNADINFEAVAVNQSSSQTITIEEQGNETLSVNFKSISDPDHFTVIEPSQFPIEIADGASSQELTIRCTPSEQGGEYPATLTLSTNAPPPNHEVSYTLLCREQSALIEQAAAVYQSTPPFESPHNLITFPPTQVGKMVSSELVIENQGTGLMMIPSIELQDNTGTFSLISPLPSSLEIFQGQQQTVTIACNPLDAEVSPKEATLIVNSNDANYPQVEYQLRCQVNQPIYHSAPAQTIAFGEVVVGETRTLSLAISQAGPLDLTVALKTPPSGHFQLLSPPNFPMTLTKTNNTITLNVQCAPSEPGLHSGELQLGSDDPNWPIITYPLVCAGIKPHYVSTPSPDETWNIGKTVIQETVSKTLKITNQGQTDLMIFSATLLPPFAIENAFPLPAIPSGGEGSVTISCTPTAATVYEDTILELATNDPYLPKPRYRLNCQGTTAPEPSYDSIPAVGQPLTIETVVTLTGTAQLEIINNGAAPLAVSEIQIVADDEEVFQLMSAAAASIPEGESRIITVQCNPLAANTAYPATLELVTDDADQPTPSYPLSCSAATIAKLDIGKTSIGVAIDKIFTVNEMEVAYAELSGPNAQAFKIIEPAIPMNSATTPIGISSLELHCQPQAGINTGQLIFYNAESKPIAVYELSCEGLSTPYVSTPPVETAISFGETPINTTSEAQLTINSNDLTVESFTIIGEHANDFKLVTPLPLTIQQSQVLSLTCTPSATGSRTAELQLKITHHPLATYPLTCLGQTVVMQPSPATPSEFNSIPEPESVLVFDSAAPTAEITILPPSQQALAVLTSAISGDDHAHFSIIEGLAPFTLMPGDPPHTLTIECTPQTSSLSAELTLTTQQAVVQHYRLSCTATETLFTGDIMTQAGQRGNYLSIDAPELLTLTGYIHPPPRHQQQTATIIARYHWWPADGGTQLTLPVILATEQSLAESLEFQLFDGRLVHLAGRFEVELGYQVGSEFLADTIATLIVRPNRPPTRISLSHAVVAEDSAPGVVIGYLQGLDPDQGEQLIYGLEDNARGRFDLMGNELRVAQGGLLNFEQYHSHDIVVRVVDSAGAFLEKTLTIEVTDITTQPSMISLTATQIWENSPLGTVIGKLVSHDREPGHYQYQLLDDAGGYFKVIGDRLVVNQKIDFEQHTAHSITVRSQKIGHAQATEQTFRLEVINMIDLEVNGFEIQTYRDMHRNQVAEKISLHIQFTPDREHINQAVDLMAVALDNTQLMMLKEQQWVLWDGDLNTLASVNSYVLKTQHEDILLWQGQRAQFPEQAVQVFIGYRLNNGEIIFQSEPIEITF